MVVLAAVFTSALLASTALAAPSSGALPFRKAVTQGGARALIAHDQARARTLLKNPHGKTVSFPVTNTIVSYQAEVQVGSPPTVFDLLIDTGSSNTWVGSRAPFQETKTTVTTGLEFAVSYGNDGAAFVVGNEVLDQVTLAPGLTIKNQSIGAAVDSNGFTAVDGILGIGPVDLTLDTTSDGNAVPTVTDNLFAQGRIAQNVVSVSFAPANGVSVTNGELTFGGVDPSKFTGKITYAPLTTTQPAAQFWGIDQKVKYAGTTLLASAGIVDTGTTLVLLALDAFEAYLAGTGATVDADTGLVVFGAAALAALKPLDFVVHGTTFALSPNAQLLPRALYADLGLPSNQTFGVVNTLGTPSGEGFDFVNGQSFLERFYSVYDTTNKRVGLATTKFTNAKTN